MPLMGMIGMMKKSVTKSIPCFLVKFPTVPQFPQRICSGATCEPQEKKCVPMMKKKNIYDDSQCVESVNLQGPAT